MLTRRAAFAFLIVKKLTEASMRKLLVLIATAVVTSGCVHVDNAANWRPLDATVNGKYYDCLRESQQGYAASSAGLSVSPYGGGGSAASASGVKTNYHMLKSCMQAQGYQKRDATTGEIVIGVGLSPIWFPLCLVAALGGGNCFENL